jgi:gamma-glutamylcyclotransferase (GGCT)/AIG2-like uncharacterized protein YtfP
MHLFLYGTLTHEHGNPVAQAIHDKLGPPRRASVAGTLLAVGTAEGWYPMLVPGTSRVQGWLHRAGPAFGPRDLALLDRYEEYAPRSPARCEFRRVVVPVRLARGGRLRAQCYAGNRQAKGRIVPVPHGDFSRFLAETGLPAFASG